MSPGRWSNASGQTPPFVRIMRNHVGDQAVNGITTKIDCSQDLEDIQRPGQPMTPDQMYRAVMRQLPHGAAFVVDSELRYVFAEGESLRAAGMTPSNLGGRTVREVIPPHAVEKVEGDYRKALAGERFETAHSVGDRQFLTHGRPLLGEDGAITGALAVSYDVTELRAAESELQAIAEARDARLETAVTELGRRTEVFLATLAHELRNPLAPISTGLTLLRRLPAGSPAVQRTHQILEQQVAQISRLVEDVFDVAGIAEGKLQLRREWIEVGALVDAACAAARPIIEARKHVLVVECSASNAHIWVDRARVTQILTNLLNNAGKYTPPGGVIELHALQVASSIEFVVKDNGVGIEKEQLDTVFELFRQLEVDADVSRSGLGVGLALVKRLTELHGGSVSAQSEGRSKGSTFTVRFPRESPTRG